VTKYLALLYHSLLQIKARKQVVPIINKIKMHGAYTYAS
jgi:hypothetical protein